MKLPLYWAKATAEATDHRAAPWRLSCWRGSKVSEAEAQQAARNAAAAAAARLGRGQPLDRYGYGQGLLREEVIERFGPADDPWAAVTRNAAGVLVLNTAQVMFIDLDLPPTTTGENLRSFVSRLMGKGGQSPEAERQAAIVARVEQFVATRPEWNIRLYRTHSGLRGLATHTLFAPQAAETNEAFTTLGADPLYARLCLAQESFRARLTPKPWRCGCAANTTRWPRQTPETQERFERWRQGYTSRQAQFATCRYLGSYGSGRVIPDAETIIEIHDKLTRSAEPLLLA